MRVEYERVRGIEAGEAGLAQARRECGDSAPRRVHVKPGAVLPADLADLGEGIDDTGRRGADRADDHEGQEGARIRVGGHGVRERAHVHAQVAVHRHRADRRGADQVARVLLDRDVGLGRDIERRAHAERQRAVAPVLVWLFTPGVVRAECRVAGGAARVAVREPIGQGDDHGGVVRLRSACGEVAGPARGIDAEGLHEKIDAELLEGSGGRMLAPHRDVGAPAVGLVHGGDGGGIGVDAEVAHVERAADVGVVKVREAAEDLHEPIHRDVAGARIESIAHERIDCLKGWGVAGRGYLNHKGIPREAACRLTRHGHRLVTTKTRVEGLRLTFETYHHYT